MAAACRVQRLLEGVEGAGADIAVDDTQCAENSRRELLVVV
jgi:hypothetical protein